MQPIYWFIEETPHILRVGWREAIQERKTKTNVVQANIEWKKLRKGGHNPKGKRCHVQCVLLLDKVLWRQEAWLRSLNSEMLSLKTPCTLWFWGCTSTVSKKWLMVGSSDEWLCEVQCSRCELTFIWFSLDPVVLCFVLWPVLFHGNLTGQWMLRWS